MQRIFPTTETYEVEVVGGWGGCGEAWIQFRMSHLLFFTVLLEVLDIVFLGVSSPHRKGVIGDSQDLDFICVSQKE